MFSQGEIDQIGTGPELYSNPATRFVAGFIGDSNFLDASVITMDAGKAKLSLGDGAVVEGVPLHGAPAKGAKASLMLRPERLSLSRAAVPAGLAVTVRDITFLGNNVEVSTATKSGADLAVRLPFGHEAISSLARGEQAWLTFDTAAAHAFA